MAVLIFVLLLWAELYGRKHQISFETRLNFLILTGLCLYASVPLFTQSFKQSDDICYHLLRIEGLKDGMLDGQFPVVIFPEALAGNGYLNSMYPYLFLYSPWLLDTSQGCRKSHGGNRMAYGTWACRDFWKKLCYTGKQEICRLAGSG